MTPRTCILRTAGTNCDVELAHAFRLAGAEAEFVHLNALTADPAMLESFDILALPGGFSYGDDIAAGRIWANRLRHRLMPALRRFVAAGKPVIGICNGFQVLVKAGLLPGFELNRAAPDAEPPAQQATLADNLVPRFVDRWVDLRVDPETLCIWTKGLDRLPLCIAHGEGRLVASDDVLDELESNGQVALRYVENPNGSKRGIAGICDPTGLVFGLMPHPERFCHPANHPAWTRDRPVDALTDTPAGLKFFLNAIEHVTQHTAAQPT